MKYCHNCGVKLENTPNYCSSCGVSLKLQTESTRNKISPHWKGFAYFLISWLIGGTALGFLQGFLGAGVTGERFGVLIGAIFGIVIWVQHVLTQRKRQMDQLTSEEDSFQ